ncbi:MAG: preprotein translocase subunit SecG [Candidatus Omnitrophica bacterium]|nr:preprotein translocase subunit SecG [Candidatus Omnitrophota bacterium]
MGFVLAIHVIVCILLVISILMQAGRGGGLTETFQSAESMFGTRTNVFMVRFTTVLAVIFMCTSLLFAFKFSKGSTSSLMSNKKLLATVPKTPAPKPSNEPEVQVKVESPRVMNPAETGLPAKETPKVPQKNAKP